MSGHSKRGWEWARWLTLVLDKPGREKKEMLARRNPRSLKGPATRFSHPGVGYLVRLRK